MKGRGEAGQNGARQAGASQLGARLGGAVTGIIHRGVLALLLTLALGGAASAQRVEDAGTRLASELGPGLKAATFAAGCFWCVEPPFDKLAGVVSTTSGYTGGRTPGPTYKQVGAGDTGHTEAVRVVYDPAKVSYETLLEVFWRNVDPLDADGQFCDRGAPYRPAVFVHDEEQARAAEASKGALQASGRFKQPVVVPVEPARDFWVAEEYHQDYHVRNPIRYRYYRSGCGRDARLEALWGKPIS